MGVLSTAATAAVFAKVGRRKSEPQEVAILPVQELPIVEDDAEHKAAADKLADLERQLSDAEAEYEQLSQIAHAQKSTREALREDAVRILAGEKMDTEFIPSIAVERAKQAHRRVEVLKEAITIQSEELKRCRTRAAKRLYPALAAQQRAICQQAIEAGQKLLECHQQLGALEYHLSMRSITRCELPILVYPGADASAWDGHKLRSWLSKLEQCAAGEPVTDDLYPLPGGHATVAPRVTGGRLIDADSDSYVGGVALTGRPQW